MNSASRNRPLLASVNSRNFAWPVVILTFVIALIRLAGLVADGSVNVIYGDQWDFLAPLFRDEGPLAGFLQQHGPHRQGLGGALQWALYELSGWNTRWESWFIVFLLTVTTALIIGLSARLRGRLSALDALLPLIVLSPIHWETMLLSVNMSHSILPLGLITLLAWTRIMPASLFRALVTGVVGVLCLFTGFGFCATVALGGLLLLTALRPESQAARHDALLSLSFIGIGFACFFLRYTWSPAIPGWSFPVADWWNYASFVSYMAATLLGLREKTSLALGVGGLLLLGAFITLAACTLKPRRIGSPSRANIIHLFIGTGFVYMAMTAIGRLPAGIEAAFMWRYITLGSCVAVGVILFLFGIPEAAGPRTRFASHATSVLLALAVWGGFGPERAASITAQGKQLWIQAYLTTHDVAEANNRARFWIYPPEMDNTTFEARLAWLEENKLSLFKN